MASGYESLVEIQDRISALQMECADMRAAIRLQQIVLTSIENCEKEKNHEIQILSYRLRIGSMTRTQLLTLLKETEDIEEVNAIRSTLQKWEEIKYDQHYKNGTRYNEM